MRANSHLDMALGNKITPHVLGGSYCPLETKGGEKFANGALGDWDKAPNLKSDIPRASRPRNASLWHICVVLMAHYEFSTVVASRC